MTHSKSPCFPLFIIGNLNSVIQVWLSLYGGVIKQQTTIIGICLEASCKTARFFDDLLVISFVGYCLDYITMLIQRLTTTKQTNHELCTYFRCAVLLKKRKYLIIKIFFLTPFIPVKDFKTGRLCQGWMFLGQIISAIYPRIWKNQCCKPIGWRSKLIQKVY